MGLDQDQTAIKYAQKRFLNAPNVHLFNTNFSSLPDCLNQEKISHVTKIFVDLGMSSAQLDSTSRGFSFQSDAPLDMRMNQEHNLTAKDILHTYDEKALSDLFFYYGELRQNKILVRHIMEARKKNVLSTTDDLVAIIKKSYFFRNKRRAYIQTLSKVFQALRIEVNQELSHLESFLDTLPSLLALEGRVVFLTFHSLEDRMIKRFFKSNKDLFKPIEKKVVKASQEEILVNSRSHSAKLRGYIRHNKTF